MWCRVGKGEASAVIGPKVCFNQPVVWMNLRSGGVAVGFDRR